ncbi:MAG: hypothetical protein GY927_03760 [bacterium]|nr:hypothetical protein [bacterium]
MRFTTVLLLLLTASSLGACGGVDGVDVNLPFVGKITSDQKVDEKKMTTRGTLLLPPAVNGLPSPTQKQQSSKAQNWPTDPDVVAKVDAKTAALNEKKYRKDGDWSGARDNTGNGLEEFNNKIDWSKRQKGIFQDGVMKQE